MSQQVVITLPSKANDVQIEELCIEKLFPKEKIKTFGVIQLIIAALSAISQVNKILS